MDGAVSRYGDDILDGGVGVLALRAGCTFRSGWGLADRDLGADGLRRGSGSKFGELDLDRVVF